MRVLQNIVPLAFLFRLIFGKNTTDSSYLETYPSGLQKNASGSTVSPGNETFLMNPEEMGSYAEGDIMLADDFNSSKVINDSLLLLWTSVNIPYVIEGNYNAQQRQMIIQAMYTIQLWIGFRFVPHRGQTDYMAIRNDKGAGCSSFLGRIGGRQVMNLEAPLCFAKIGTTLHELLHVIGLLHEHNSPDRDQYITVNKSNVEEDKETFFKKYSSPNPKKFNEYAYNSIMHFSEYTASKNGQKTIEPKVDNFTIGQRDGLSIRDVKAVCDLYDYCESWIYSFNTDNITILDNYNLLTVSLLSEETIEIVRRDSELWALLSFSS